MEPVSITVWTKMPCQVALPTYSDTGNVLAIPQGFVNSVTKAQNYGQ